MLAKSDTTLYFNPDSLVINTRWDKSRFPGKKINGNIHEKYQSSTFKKHPPLLMQLLHSKKQKSNMTLVKSLLILQFA